MDGQVPDGFRPVDHAGAFLDHVGPVHARDDGEGSEPVHGLRLGPQHLNRGGTAQGGLLATLVDFSMGTAVRARTEDAHAATVSLTTDYLGPASEGDWLEARTKVERLGGRLAFADCSLTVDGREVVRGRGVFAVLEDG